MLNRRSSLDLSLKYAVKDLLDKIKSNKATHVANFNKAMAEYKIKMVEELEKKLKEAKEGKLVDHTVNLPRPKSFEGYYDEAYDMISMCKDTEITLDRTLFGQLVRDEWEWSNEYAVANSSYLGG